MNSIDFISEHARVQPNHPAVIVDSGADGEDVIVTYADLKARYDQIACDLRAAGCEQYQRCGLLCSQSMGFIEQALGILAAGMCFVPLSEDYDGEALNDFVKQTKLHHLLRENTNFELNSYGVEGYVDNNQDADYRVKDPAYIRFTSGTTSDRKGVLIGHASIVERLSSANKALKIGPEDRIMWMLPMAHHFVVSILLYLRHGATILLPGSYLTRPILEMSKKYQATVFYASPYHYEMLANDKSGENLDSVRLAISTASGLNLSTAEKFYERMQLPLSQALGVIEIGLPVINTERAREKPKCLGQILPDYEVNLLDDDGNPLPPRGSSEGDPKTGIIHIKGPGTFDAYLSPWVCSSEIMYPNGFSTGDEAYFDSDGDLFVLGRQHNRINMAGMKFFCEEVEEVINRHPLVAECRVLGKPHAHLGEFPMVMVVCENADEVPSLHDVQDFCRGRIANHKIPLFLTVVEELERTPTGKIKRW